jgi:hypothetical protein
MLSCASCDSINTSAASVSDTCPHCRYYLSDGTPLGNGYSSNSNPYAHWAFNYWDSLMNNPTHNCTYADYYTKYFNVRA